METIGKINNVLFNQTSELNILEYTLKSLIDSKIKTFGTKTLNEFKEKYGIVCYYHKDNIDVLNKFNIQYKAINKYGNCTEWVEIHGFNPDDIIKEIKQMIPWKLEAIEKAEKTIKQIKKIQKGMKKIIELKKEFNYTNYNSDMLQIISNDMIDSFYLNNHY